MKKLLPALLICTLPMISVAAEKAPTTGGQDTAVQSPPSAKQVTVEPTVQQQSVQLGFVDVSRLQQESDAGKTAQAQAKEKQKKLQAQIETRRKQLDKQKSALEAKFATLSPVQREAKAKEFQKKVEEFQKFVMNAEKEMQTLQEKLLDELTQAFEKAATEYGKANGLALVIVKRELLYLSSGVEAKDVTDGILALLKEKGGKK